MQQPSYIYASTLTRRQHARRVRRRQTVGPFRPTVLSAVAAVGGVAALLAHFLGV